MSGGIRKVKNDHTGFSSCVTASFNRTFLPGEKVEGRLKGSRQSIVGRYKWHPHRPGSQHRVPETLKPCAGILACWDDKGQAVPPLLHCRWSSRYCHVDRSEKVRQGAKVLNSVKKKKGGGECSMRSYSRRTS